MHKFRGEIYKIKLLWLDPNSERPISPLILPFHIVRCRDRLACMTNILTPFPTLRKVNPVPHSSVLISIIYIYTTGSLSHCHQNTHFFVHLTHIIITHLPCYIYIVYICRIPLPLHRAIFRRDTDPCYTAPYYSIDIPSGLKICFFSLHTLANSRCSEKQEYNNVRTIQSSVRVFVVCSACPARIDRFLHKHRTRL